VSTPIPDFEEFKQSRTPRTKPGVRLDGVAPDLIDFARERDFTVTSGRDAPGVHARNSRHGDGNALDLRVRDKSPEEVRRAAEEARAAGYHVIDKPHGTGPHLHVERPDNFESNATSSGGIPDFETFKASRAVTAQSPASTPPNAWGEAVETTPTTSGAATPAIMARPPQPTQAEAPQTETRLMRERRMTEPQTPGAYRTGLSDKERALEQVTPSGRLLDRGGQVTLRDEEQSVAEIAREAYRDLGNRRGLDPAASEAFAAEVVGLLARQPDVMERARAARESGDTNFDLRIDGAETILNRRLAEAHGDGVVAPAASSRPRPVEGALVDAATVAAHPASGLSEVLDRRTAIHNSEDLAEPVGFELGAIKLQTNPRDMVTARSTLIETADDLKHLASNLAAIPKAVLTGESVGRIDPLGWREQVMRNRSLIEQAYKSHGGEQTSGEKLLKGFVKTPVPLVKVMALARAVGGLPRAMALLSFAERMDEGAGPAAFEAYKSFLMGKSFDATSTLDPRSADVVQGVLGFAEAKLSGASTEDAVNAGVQQLALGRVMQPGGARHGEAPTAADPLSIAQKLRIRVAPEGRTAEAPPRPVAGPPPDPRVVALSDADLATRIEQLAAKPAKGTRQTKREANRIELDALLSEAATRFARAAPRPSAEPEPPTSPTFKEFVEEMQPRGGIRFETLSPNEPLYAELKAEYDRQFGAGQNVSAGEAAADNSVTAASAEGAPSVASQVAAGEGARAPEPVTHHSAYQPRRVRGEGKGQFKRGKVQYPEEANVQDVVGAADVASAENVLPPVARPLSRPEVVGAEGDAAVRTTEPVDVARPPMAGVRAGDTDAPSITPDLLTARPPQSPEALRSRFKDGMVTRFRLPERQAEGVTAVIDAMDAGLTKWGLERGEMLGRVAGVGSGRAKGDVLNQVAGRKGAARLEDAPQRLDNLRVAKEMEKAGKDVKAVYLATGWEKGADGKWKTEIDDSTTTTRPLFNSLKEIAKKRVDLPFQYDEVYYRKTGEGQYDVTLRRENASSAVKDFYRLKDATLYDIGNVSPEVEQLIRERRGVDELTFDDKFENEITHRVAKASGEVRANALPLEHALNHPELFDAYPDLKDVTVAFDAKRNEFNGQRGALARDADGDLVIMLSPNMSDAEIKSTLHHEIQHRESRAVRPLTNKGQRRGDRKVCSRGG
jgi:hypothetical protein